MRQTNSDGRGEEVPLALDLFITASRFSRSAAQVPKPPGRHPGVVWRVLSTLWYQGPMRISQIAVSERVTQSSMTTTVNRMERLALVARRPDPSDGRAVLVHLTAEGTTLMQDHRLLVAERMSPYVDGLSDIDAAVLRRSVEIMRDLIDVVDSPS